MIKQPIMKMIETMSQGILTKHLKSLKKRIKRGREKCDY
jgi:DNA-binding HxlR family transcriptional regulator